MLDVGCGGGILADAMSRSGAAVTGIDLAAKALRVAQLHALEAQTVGVTYREISAEGLAAEQAGSFDRLRGGLVGGSDCTGSTTEALFSPRDDRRRRDLDLPARPGACRECVDAALEPCCELCAD